MPIFLLMCKLAGANVIKLFSSSQTVQQNKLVCLTLTLFKHASYVRVRQGSYTWNHRNILGGSSYYPNMSNTLAYFDPLSATTKKYLQHSKQENFAFILRGHAVREKAFLQSKFLGILLKDLTKGIKISNYLGFNGSRINQNMYLNQKLLNVI